jgi:hypothetical protein
MFGRIQPVKNGSAVSAAEPGDDGDDAVVADFHLRRACQDFFEALQAYVAFNPETSSAGGPQPTTDGQRLEEVAYEKMERALQELRSLRASCPGGFQAKFEALFSLEDWFSKEDFRVVDFAFELAEEAYAFFVADSARENKLLPRTRSGSSRERRQSRLSFARLPWFAAEPKSSMPSRAHRSQS